MLGSCRRCSSRPLIQTFCSSPSAALAASVRASCKEFRLRRPDIPLGQVGCHKCGVLSVFLLKYVSLICEFVSYFSHWPEIEIYPLHYSFDSVKKTYFNSDEDIYWPPQCHNFGSTAEAGGFTAGAADPAVNMLEEALASVTTLTARSALPPSARERRRSEVAD